MRSAGADLGIAWDGDFDRCFFFDGNGDFVPTECVVALLAQAMLEHVPGANIVHDTRAEWNTRDCIFTAGGTPVRARSGHTYMKAAMRKADAAYGGELAAHHYFRDFMYCDSGMIPWLLMLEILGRSSTSLAELVHAMKGSFPSSGEHNFKVVDADATMVRIEARYGPRAQAVDRIDGLSFDMGAWCMNVRRSSTEPLLRLNVETREDTQLLAEMLKEVSDLILSTGGA